MPDGMGLIWYCTKQVRSEDAPIGWYVSVGLRVFGMKEFCDRKLRLKSNLI